MAAIYKPMRSYAGPTRDMPPSIPVIDPGMGDKRAPLFGCAAGRRNNSCYCSVVNNGRVRVNFDAVKVQIAAGYWLTRPLHIAEDDAIDRQSRDVRPYGDPVVREGEEAIDILLFGEQPIILFGLPDLTLHRRKVCDVQSSHTGLLTRPSQAPS
jgi:hypothetical protein